MAENVSLKISSAVIIGGKLVKAGEVVEASGADAKDLLHRGKATLATSEKPRVAIHFTDEVHVPEAPAAEPEAEAEQATVTEPAAEAPVEKPVKAKATKKAK